MTDLDKSIIKILAGILLLSLLIIGLCVGVLSHVGKSNSSNTKQKPIEESDQEKFKRICIENNGIPIHTPGYMYVDWECIQKKETCEQTKR